MATRNNTGIPRTSVENFIKLVNDGDADAFLDLFTNGGYVDDWGRQYMGREDIKGWSDKEFIGAQGRMTLKRIEQEGRSFTFDWKSNHYGGSGSSRITFDFEGNKIKAMSISAE